MSERKETASTGKPAPIKIVLKGWSDVDTQLMQAALIKAKINKAFAKYNEIEQKARNAFSEATKELKDEYDRIEAAVLMFAELHKGDFEKSKTKKLDNGSVAASYSHPNFIKESMAVRRLTPTECERLQGYPDGWTGLEDISDSARYRMLGNSVAVPVVEWIMRRIVTPQEKPPVVQESTPEGGIVVKVPEKPERVVNRGKPCQPVVKHMEVQRTLDMYPTEA
jgi:site-specific DNA-cytosine methylase